jgi:proteasome accessory factor A
MNRIVGIETEYGCLTIKESTERSSLETWPQRVKNHIFKARKLGILDIHYRDYEEPPGNGGFLVNGGRVYMDMGHLEYCTPECLTVADAVSYDLAGDQMVWESVRDLGAEDEVGFYKNNIDHYTGATFGCHENYLTRRETAFHSHSVEVVLSFLATRQVFAGAGRVGMTIPLGFEAEMAPDRPVRYQMSQRADHIVNDIYQWVQFNRSMINARDEPLADYRRFRRLHLLIGDSNMSPYATALKLGTTHLVLRMVEEETLPAAVSLANPVLATREISRSGDPMQLVTLVDGSRAPALEIQQRLLVHGRDNFGGVDPEIDWILSEWQWVLDALRTEPETLVGAVDWISKQWLLETFRREQGVGWEDPWLKSLDLEYHHIHPERGLYFAVPQPARVEAFNRSVRRSASMHEPPADTRAFGRGKAVQEFLREPRPYVINWDSLGTDATRSLMMPNPFDTYERAVGELLASI